MNWIGFAILLAVVFVGRILITKDNLKKITKIDSDYETWVKADAKTNRPNNATFTDLYKTFSGETTMNMTHFDGNRVAVLKRQIDVIASFPTMDRQVMAQLLPLIDNMKDFFQERFNENFSLIFWIKLLIYLPQNALQYIGVKDTSIANKIANFTWWLVVALGIICKPLIVKLISSFF